MFYGQTVQEFLCVSVLINFCSGFILIRWDSGEHASPKLAKLDLNRKGQGMVSSTLNLVESLTMIRVFGKGLSIFLKGL